MNIVEHKIDDRLYKALSDGSNHIILGPPEGLVDELGLPEPFATRLHNTLYRRGIMKYEDAMRKPNDLIGALQECYLLDVQILTQTFFEFEKEK